MAASTPQNVVNRRSCCWENARAGGVGQEELCEEFALRARQSLSQRSGDRVTNQPMGCSMIQ